MCLNVFIKTTNHSVILVYISVYNSLKIYLVNLTVKIYGVFFIKLWKNSYVFINSYCFILKLLFGQLVLPLAQSELVRSPDDWDLHSEGLGNLAKKIPLLLFWISNIVLTLLRWNGWMLFSTGICLMFIIKTSYHEWTTIFPFIRCH